MSTALKRLEMPGLFESSALNEPDAVGHQTQRMRAGKLLQHLLCVRKKIGAGGKTIQVCRGDLRGISSAAQGVQERAEPPCLERLQSDRALLESAAVARVDLVVGGQRFLQGDVGKRLCESLGERLGFRPVIIEEGVVGVEEEASVFFH